MKQQTSASEASTVVVRLGVAFFPPSPSPLPPPPHFPCGVLSDTKKLYYYKRIRGWTSAESHCIKRTGKLNPGTK